MRLAPAVWALIYSRGFKLLYFTYLTGALLGIHEAIDAPGKLRALKALAAHEASILKWTASRFHLEANVKVTGALARSAA